MASFETFRQKHDPNGREDYTFEFRLNTGEAIASATVDVVDESSETIDVATDLVLEATAFGQVNGTVYGVTTWVSEGTAASGTTTKYYLRCRGETTASPISRLFDRTMILECKQL